MIELKNWPTWSGRTYAYRLTWRGRFPIRRPIETWGSRQGKVHTECKRLGIGPIVLHRYTVTYREPVPWNRPIPGWREKP